MRLRITEIYAIDAVVIQAKANICKEKAQEKLTLMALVHAKYVALKVPNKIAVK